MPSSRHRTVRCSPPLLLRALSGQTLANYLALLALVALGIA